MAAPPPDTSFVERLTSLILLVIFACATIYGTLEVQFPEAHQQFFLSVFTSLAAAAIAAIIPGVFEFETRMLAMVIRASGALGVFALVYFHSPTLVNGNNEQLAELRSTWYWMAVTRGSGLGYGARQYGGVANFDIQPGRFGPYIMIAATVNWMVDEERNELVRLPYPAKKWTATNGAVSGPDQLLYQYVAEDGPEHSDGFASYRIVRDEKGQISELTGNFQRMRNYSNVFGDIQMFRQLSCEDVAKKLGAKYTGAQQQLVNNVAHPLPAPRAPSSSSCD